MTPTAFSRYVRFPAGRAAPSWLLAAGLLTLLSVLASLQYRWLEEVSRADRDKSRDLLQAAVARFAEDFDRELTRALLYFQPRPTDGLRAHDDQSFARRYQRWQTYAPHPELVRDVYMAWRGDGGALQATRFDPAAGAFVSVPWPTELDQLQQRWSGERRWPRRGEPRDAPAGFQILADEVPALVLPMFGGGLPGAGPPGEPSHPPRFRPARSEDGPRDDRPGDDRPGDDRRSGPPTPGGRGLMVVSLDLDNIRDVILPELSDRHLHGDGTEYQARVFALSDQRVIFRRGAPLEEAAPLAGDAGAGLFGLLPQEKLGTLELEAGLAPVRDQDRRSERGPPAAGPRRRLREDRYHRLYRFISTGENSRWRVVASHPAGSLDAAVAKAHRRNLAISFGILLLLGASLMLMLLSTRRLQALARQQLEFVAGVTHELLTPLAAMRSAGQNLADGVVAEPRQVQRYGRLVDDEGRRLSTMVEQVLEFAGMQAGRKSYAFERTRLATVVDDALAEYAPVLEEQGVRVEKRLDDDLPDVMADAGALRRALQNLIANAVKYGAQGHTGNAWIGLRIAAGGPRGRELRLSVEDRGPGIATADLPRLFEPFYRGRGGTSDAIPGSGLGLSLVKHIAEGHGGRITVATEKGAGSTFTLHLPAAAARPAGARSASDRQGSLDEL